MSKHQFKAKTDGLTENLRCLFDDESSARQFLDKVSRGLGTVADLSSGRVIYESPGQAGSARGETKLIQISDIPSYVKR